MPIHVYPDGTAEPDPATTPAGLKTIKVYKAGWKRVIAAFTYHADNPTVNPTARKVFDIRPQGTTVLTGGTLVAGPATTAPLRWTPMPGGVNYQIVRRKGTWNATTRTFTKDATPEVFSTLFPADKFAEDVSGLAADTTYSFRVRWFNDSGVASQESNEVVITTGHPRLVETGDTTFYPRAYRTNSWNSAGGVNAPPGPAGAVVQGSRKDVGSQNSRGVVDYSNLFGQLKNLVRAKLNPANVAYYGSQLDAKLEQVTSALVVDDALIRQVYRVNDTIGSKSGVLIRVYRGNANFGSDKLPTIAATSPDYLRFTSPVEGAAKPDTASSARGFRLQRPNGDTDTTVFLSWVRAFAKKNPSNAMLVIYTNDGTGNDTIGYNKFCILRNVDKAGPSYTQDWDLVLDVHWSVETVALLNTVWNKQQ